MMIKKTIKPNKISGSLIALLFLLCLPMGVTAQSPQQKDTIQRKENIKASDYMIPKRRGADRFQSRKGTEHLFFSTGGGVVRLLDMGSGYEAQGFKASFYAGNWITPVIGVRIGGDYSLWEDDKTHIAGASLDYLMNLSAFASRYNPKRVFEVVAVLGLSYQATMKSGIKPVHSYGLHGGLQGKFNVSPAFNLFIEPQLGIYPDQIDNHYSWRRFDLIASAMVGVTYKPAGSSELSFLRDGFVSVSAGTGNTGNTLFNTEFALGKWFGKSRINGVRLSAGSSTAFLDNEDGAGRRDFNVNLCADYLCNLTTLFSDRKSRIFDLLFIAGAGSYFPGAESSSKMIVNGRFGFQGQMRLTEHLGLWLEPRVNLFKDKSYRADLQEPIRGTIGVMIGASCMF